jgi:hypothetical protein
MIHLTKSDRGFFFFFFFTSILCFELFGDGFTLSLKNWPKYYVLLPKPLVSVNLVINIDHFQEGKIG